MKRYKYVVAAVCLLLGGMGFLGLYATKDTQEKNEQAKNQQIVEESEEQTYFNIEYYYRTYKKVE